MAVATESSTVPPRLSGQQGTRWTNNLSDGEHSGELSSLLTSFFFFLFGCVCRG